VNADTDCLKIRLRCVAATRKTIGTDYFSEGIMGKAIFKANAVLDMNTGLKVVCESGGKEIILDEPEGLGGTDLGMNPIEALLNALGACKCIVTRLAAKSMGIPLESLSIECKGTLDPDGFQDINPNAKIGLSEIETVFHIKSSANDADIEKLIAYVDSHCPVNDTIKNPPALSRKIDLQK